MILKKFALVLAILGVTTASMAGEITFDSGLINTQYITNGYEGLDWTNFRARDTNDLAPSGFTHGTVSGDFVAYSRNGTVSSIESAASFQLLSGYFTAAWLDNLQLTVTAYKGNTQVGQSSFFIDSTAPSFLTFGFGAIDKVTFATAGGTNGNWGGNQSTFVVDNLRIAPVPEPETYAMLLAGLGLLGFVRRRRAGY